MLVSGRIEKFKHFSHFESIKQFNNTIEMFLAEHKKQFTKGELIALKRLIRYSAKYFGVANARIGTLLKAINQAANGFGVSRSTFERMLRKAKALGILAVRNTKRKSGGKGPNVYVFNPIDASKSEQLTYCKDGRITRHGLLKRRKTMTETGSFKTSMLLFLNVHKRRVMDYTYVSDYVPREFVRVVKNIADSAKMIEGFWRVVEINAATVEHTLDRNEMTLIAISSAKQVFRRLQQKKNQPLNNPIGYFTAILKKKITRKVRSKQFLAVFES